MKRSAAASYWAILVRGSIGLAKIRVLTSFRRVTCAAPANAASTAAGSPLCHRMATLSGASGQMIGAPRVTYASPDAPPAARNIYHDAIMAALERCTPLPFTPGLGGAVAGRPIAIRYVDDRNAE